MTKILMFKEKIKKIYSEHDVWLTRGLRFALAFFSLIVMWINIGSNPIMRNPIAIIVVSVICAFIPLKFDILILLFAMLMHLYSVSADLAGIALILFLVMYFLYYKFTVKDSLVIILLPILFFAKIPYIIPMVLGLYATPVSLIPIIFGTMIYFIMDYATTMGDSSFGVVLSSIFSNEIYLLTFVCMIFIFIIVYVIRRRSINHSHEIAIITAGIVNIVIMITGYIFLGTIKLLPILFIVLGVAISILIAYILHFGILSLDYSQTEFTQFEDDDYYYYVKAVPKVKVTAQEVSVKRINVQKPKRK